MARARRFDYPHLNVLRAATELHEERILLVRKIEDVTPPLVKAQPRAMRIGRADHLNLRDHDRLVAGSVKAALDARD